MNGWRDKEEFKSRVGEWAAKLGVKAHSLAVRPMRNKWASCSTAGNLNFNSELLGFDREIGDYVIVHELLHFSVPNHGKLWKSLMRAHLGDYEQLDERLRRLTTVSNAHYDRPSDLGQAKACTPTSARRR
jgi:predicted metal-dependent hydrolase